jgi:hypothetical protein
MNRTGLLIILAGVVLVWMGLRSLVGYQQEVDHLHAGQFRPITCDGGEAVGGPGWLSPAADYTCEQARRDQQGRAPWWIATGLVVTAYGIVDVRRDKGSS